MSITKCSEALAAWDRGDPITSINISGMGLGYERGCQALMFEAIRQHIDREGDVSFWLSMKGQDASSFFTAASDFADKQDMTGAMLHASLSAAVVMLRNTWAGGIGMAPADRLFEVAIA